jgi:hypothetical protein
MERCEEKADVCAERGGDDVHAEDRERIEEPDDIFRVTFHARRRNTRRLELPPEVATDDAMALGEPPGDRLPRSEGHHAAVQEQQRRAFPVQTVGQHS